MKTRGQLADIGKQLYSACKNGDIEEVQQLLQKNTPNNNINWRDIYGATPLVIASQEGHTEIVKLLLNDPRIDVNEPTNYGQTAFWIACSKGSIETVKVLLNDPRVDVNQATYHQTPFYMVCSNAFIEIVKLLSNVQRIDVNFPNDSGRTPLFYACQRGFTEVVEYILASGKEIDLHTKDSEGMSALDLGRYIHGRLAESDKSKRNYSKIIELLESFDRNPNETRFNLRMQLGFSRKKNNLLLLIICLFLFAYFISFQF